MSNQLLPTSVDCCRDPCRETLTTTVPGPQGEAGENGTNGTDGENAYTLTTDSFTVPAEGATVIIEVANSDWMVESVNPDGLIYIQGAGTFQVTDIPDSTHAEIKNIADVANGIYPDNNTGALVSTGKRVSPTGIQGPEGAEPAGALLIANELSELSGVADNALANLGVVIGTADTNIPPVDEAGGLDAGEAVFATATGLETLADVDAFNALSPLTTRGDLLTRDATNNIRLAIGAANTVLKTDGTDASWGKVTAAMLDTGVGGVSRMFKANKNGTPQTPGLNGQITFGTEEFDPAGVFAANTFTANADGYYKFTLHLTINPNGATANLGVSLYKNGGPGVGTQVAEWSEDLTGWSGAQNVAEINVTLDLNSSETIAVYLTEIGGGAPSVLGQTYESWFEGFCLATN